MSLVTRKLFFKINHLELTPHCSATEISYNSIRKVNNKYCSDRLLAESDLGLSCSHTIKAVQLSYRD